MFAFLGKDLGAVADWFGGDAVARPPAATPAKARAQRSGDPEAASEALGFWAEDDVASAAPKNVPAKAPSPDKLDPKGFEDLLAKGTPAQLQEAYDAATDPKRKVQLWGAIARDQASGDMDHALEETDTKHSTHDFFRAETTEHEIDEEVAHMLVEIDENKGTKKAITAKDIEELAERKKLERDIELEYGVNLTNSTELKPTHESARVEPTERRVWSKDELVQLANTLRQLPPEVARDNFALREIERDGVPKEWDPKTHQWVVSDTTNSDHDPRTGKIRIYDRSFDPDARHADEVGDTSELEGHTAGNKVTPLEYYLTHEIGHNVGDRVNKTAYEDFEKAAGWTTQPVKELDGVLGKLPPGERADKQRALADGGHVVVDGRLYHIQHGELVSVPEGNLPEADQNVSKPIDIWNLDDEKMPRWGYAKDGPKEHFAESYAKAIHTPERLYDDLVVKPAQELLGVEVKREQLNDQIQQMRADGIDEDTIHASEQELAKMDDKIWTLRDNVASMKEQHRILREEVFGMSDAKVHAAANELAAVGGLPRLNADRQALLTEFEGKARAAMTDAQLENLKQEYLAKLYD